jgi:prephenate dehydratase
VRAEARVANEASLPIVVVVSGVPLLSQGVESALEGIAEVRSFPAGSGETADFLRLLQPGAVVVDSAEEAEAASGFARETRTMLVQVSLRDHKLRLMHDGRWQELPNGSASPERIRSAVAAGIYLREVRS